VICGYQGNAGFEVRLERLGYDDVGRVVWSEVVAEFPHSFKMRLGELFANVRPAEDSSANRSGPFGVDFFASFEPTQRAENLERSEAGDYVSPIGPDFLRQPVTQGRGFRRGSGCDRDDDGGIENEVHYLVERPSRSARTSSAACSRLKSVFGDSAPYSRRSFANASEMVTGGSLGFIVRSFPFSQDQNSLVKLQPCKSSCPETTHFVYPRLRITALGMSLRSAPYGAIRLKM